MKECKICGSKEFKIKSPNFCSQKCIHTWGRIRMKEDKIKCSICHKKFGKGFLTFHMIKHENEKKFNPYECENCHKKVKEKYGSGRFCSSKCSRSFSTKAKRKEINQKVSKALKGRFIKDPHKKICIICKNSFETKNPYHKTCGKICRIELTATKNRGKRYTIKDSSNMRGIREGGGRSKALEYKLVRRIHET